MPTYTHNDWLMDKILETEKRDLRRSTIDYTMDTTDRKIFIRDIKAKMASIENSIPLIESRFKFKEHKKNYQKLIESLSSIGVVCGSLSLYVHGLIDRHPKDIDLLVDKHSDTIKKFIIKNNDKINKYKNDDKSSFNNVVESFDPVEQFKTSDIMIDMFHDTDVKWIEYNGIRVQCPFQVIQKKIDIYDKVFRNKDLTDLKLIAKRLEKILEEQEDRMEIDYLISQFY